jgi:hypothetical protein
MTGAQVEEVVVRTLEEVPEGGTHWSKRELARRAGISPSSVLRIWRALGLLALRGRAREKHPKPHRSRREVLPVWTPRHCAALRERTRIARSVRALI